MRMYYDLPSNSLHGEAPETIWTPDHWQVSVSEIHGYHSPKLSRSRLRERILYPAGAPSIAEGASGKNSAVILFDDMTRPTPCGDVAEIVTEELQAAGVPEENIWFIAAIGAHGCMYRSDFVRKLGENIVDRYAIYNHNAFANHVSLGTTGNGIPIEINADVMAAEYKIAIGTMMPHSFYGFSGGAKSVLPGVSSLKTIMANHRFACPNEFNMGKPDTRIRRDAEEAADMLGLDLKIDVILNGKSEICEVFAGDHHEASEQAREYAAHHYRAAFVPDCDVVISNNYFKPLEASCAYTPEVIASLKKGGSFVLAANSPYGCCVHYLYDNWGQKTSGGFLWEGNFTPTEEMEQMLIFAKYTVKGMRDAWFVDEKKGAVYEKEWDDIIGRLDDGSPKKVVIYPMAESQILNNSHEYYTDRDMI